MLPGVLSCAEVQLCHSSNAGEPPAQPLTLPTLPHVSCKADTFILQAMASCHSPWAGFPVGLVFAPSLPLRLMPVHSSYLSTLALWTQHRSWVGKARTPGAVLQGSPQWASLHPCLICCELMVGSQSQHFHIPKPKFSPKYAQIFSNPCSTGQARQASPGCWHALHAEEPRDEQS